ncbi:hypothetical protein AB0C77_12650 [Streptomyces sp. NPDC048629]|uniref:hypothetical protein n=1 Tax=Streptomyces sp. NPDC048629 TaxID=3154824 RepID=UPI00342597F6
MNRAVMWGAGGAAVAVLALSGYALLGGDEETPGTPGKGGGTASAPATPGPEYTAPSDWSEPDRWAALPRGSRTDKNTNPVGFPHTLEGAVAMMAAANTTAVEGDRSSVDEQLGIFRSYVADADQTAANADQVEDKAAETDEKIRKQMGVGAGADLPSGAYVRSHVVGFQVIEKSADEVSVWILTRSTTKTGETKPEDGAYARTLVAAEWMGGDWKLSGASINRAVQQTRSQPKPDMVAPGDEAFNRAGWTAIREAS